MFRVLLLEVGSYTRLRLRHLILDEFNSLRARETELANLERDAFFSANES